MIRSKVGALLRAGTSVGSEVNEVKAPHMRAQENTIT